MTAQFKLHYDNQVVAVEDLQALQSKVDSGDVLPGTIVQIVAQKRVVHASKLPGLRWEKVETFPPAISKNPGETKKTAPEKSNVANIQRDDAEGLLGILWRSWLILGFAVLGFLLLIASQVNWTGDFVGNIFACGIIGVILGGGFMLASVCVRVLLRIAAKVLE